MRPPPHHDRAAPNCRASPYVLFVSAGTPFLTPCPTAAFPQLFYFFAGPCWSCVSQPSRSRFTFCACRRSAQHCCSRNAFPCAARHCPHERRQVCDLCLSAARDSQPVLASVQSARRRAVATYCSLALALSSGSRVHFCVRASTILFLHACSRSLAGGKCARDCRVAARKRRLSARARLLSPLPL